MIKVIALGLLLTAPFFSHAQGVKQHVPVVSLGRLPLPEQENGKLIPVNTNRRDLLKNSLFIADVNNCQVTEYKLSIIAPGQHFYGPVYIASNELTDSIKNKLRDQDGPDVKLYIEDIKVNYRGKEMSVNSLAFKYDN
jgi:hypothetical protein